MPWSKVLSFVILSGVEKSLSSLNARALKNTKKLPEILKAGNTEKPLQAV